jgi:hypothetical protein
MPQNGCNSGFSCGLCFFDDARFTVARVQVVVVDVHPWDPRLVLTCGYDGRVIIWNIMSGTLSLLNDAIVLFACIVADFPIRQTLAPISADER